MMLETLMMLAVLGQCSNCEITTQDYYHDASGEIVKTSMPIAEHQHVRGITSEKTRLYQAIEMPDGYKATIPVINGIMPIVTRTIEGGISRLDLNYTNGLPYESYGKDGGVVKYRVQVAAKQPVQQPIQAKAPQQPVPVAMPPRPEPIKRIDDSEIDDLLTPNKMVRPSKIRDDGRVIIPRYNP